MASSQTINLPSTPNLGTITVSYGLISAGTIIGTVTFVEHAVFKGRYLYTFNNSPTAVLAAGTYYFFDGAGFISEVVTVPNADGTYIADRENVAAAISAATNAATQTTKAKIREALNARWTDEGGNYFDAILTDTPAP